MIEILYAEYIVRYKWILLGQGGKETPWNGSLAQWPQGCVLKIY